MTTDSALEGQMTVVVAKVEVTGEVEEADIEEAEEAVTREAEAMVADPVGGIEATVITTREAGQITMASKGGKIVAIGPNGGKTAAAVEDTGSETTTIGIVAEAMTAAVVTVANDLIAGQEVAIKMVGKCDERGRQLGR